MACALALECSEFLALQYPVCVHQEFSASAKALPVASVL